MSTASGGGTVDVLIVTAVKDEWDAVLAVETGASAGSAWVPLRDASGIELRVRDFDAEGGGRLRFAVVQTFGMGDAQAVIAASRPLDAYNVRCLAMCGVCAGRRGDVALGDVIVADRLWRYDSGKVKATLDAATGDQNIRVQGDIEMFRLHPPEWKQQAERFTPDLEAPWVKARPRSYDGFTSGRTSTILRFTVFGAGTVDAAGRSPNSFVRESKMST